MDEDKEKTEKKKKKKQPTAQQLRRYNAYAKKEALAGRMPISRDKWLKIHGGEKD
jgi:hypothetical protein